MHWVGLHHAERAKREATERSRRGDLEGARHVLRGVARRMAEYAGGDAELQATLAGLREVEHQVADRPADVWYAKELRFQAQRASRGQRHHRRE